MPSFLANFCKGLLCLTFIFSLSWVSGAVAGTFALELRLKNLDVTAPLANQGSFQIPSADLEGVQGQLSDLQAEWSVEKLGIQNNQFGVKDLRLELRSKSWKYKKNEFFDIECTDLKLRISLGDILISQELLMANQFELKRNSAGKLMIKYPFQKLLHEGLKHRFQSHIVSQALQLDAQCPSNSKEVLEGFLEAWLVDFPQKRKGDWLNILEQLETELLAVIHKIPALQNFLMELDSRIIKGIDLEQLQLSLVMRRSLDPNVLRLLPRLGRKSLAVEELLSAEERALLFRYSLSGKVELLVHSSTLNDVTSYLSQMLPFFEKTQDQSLLSIVIEAPLKVDQFAGVFPEFLPYAGQDLDVQVKVNFADCRANPKFPDWIPFVDFAGRTLLDLEWQMNLEFVLKNSGLSVTQRRLSPFFLRLLFSSPEFSSSAIERLKVDFVEAGMLPIGPNFTSENNCTIEEAPPELNLTLDWLLESERFKKAMQESLLQPIHQSLKNGPRSLRYIGMPLDSLRHGNSGYKATAWVLEL